MKETNIKLESKIKIGIAGFSPVRGNQDRFIDTNKYQYPKFHCLYTVILPPFFSEYCFFSIFPFFSTSNPLHVLAEGYCSQIALNTQRLAFNSKQERSLYNTKLSFKISLVFI